MHPAQSESPGKHQSQDHGEGKEYHIYPRYIPSKKGKDAVSEGNACQSENAIFRYRLQMKEVPVCSAYIAVH